MELQEQLNDAELIARYIEPNPHKPGPADVWLKDRYISVWAIVGYYQANGRDVADAAAAYEIPVSTVQAALAYYRQNLAVIEARLEANAG